MTEASPPSTSSNSSGPFAFSLLGTCPATRARRGRIRTPHGEAETPAFMPVGTAASVKGLTPHQVARTGSQIVLCNTYHLALRPGAEVVEALGGLHAFMQWDGPILTDSGGYQVFSLGELTAVDKKGVTFRNHIDGKYLRLTPERAMEIQRQLGSDIIMAFDECLPHTATHAEHASSLQLRTKPWGERCLELRPNDGRAVFGIGQGGLFEDLRRDHMRWLREMPWDGLAIGGLSVGETGADFRRMIEVSTDEMPADRPRYLMGVGTVPELIDAIALGVDMFDCVYPTRNARNAQALTFDGPLRLKNNRFITDSAPIEADCPCETCQGGYSRAYLRHLLMAKEILGATLMTMHNLSFMARLMQRVRDALEAGEFERVGARLKAPYEKRPAAE